MTLSNIFFGKKVVQQVYIGQTKIYQSTGWETLPATVQQVWQVQPSTIINTVAVDSQGNTYVGDGGVLKKFSSDGIQKWIKAVSTYTVVSVAVDSQDNIIVGGHYVYKYDTSGNLLWTCSTIIGYVNNKDSIAVDSKGNIYAYSQINETYTISKIDGNTGKLLASVASNGYDKLVTDSQDNIYSATGINTLVKYNSSLAELWSVSLPGGSNGLAVDSQNNIYVVSNTYFVKYSSNGTQLWTKNTIGEVDAVAVDSQDNIYVGASGNKLLKFSSDGTQIWQTTLSNYVGAIAVDAQGNVYTGNSSGYVTKFLQLIQD